jgi:iron complex transport system substrate-binding protein
VRGLALALALACGGSPSPEPAVDEAGVPWRIASQTVLGDEILWDLGPAVRERVVAVSRMADDGRYSLVAGLWPREVARVGGGAEALLARAPDLALVAGFTAAETRRMLAQAGVSTVELGRLDGFVAYREHVRSVARATGAVAAGDELVAAFDARRARIEAKRAPARASVASWEDGRVAGAGTTFDDAARTAGLRNLAAERGVDGHTAVPVEQLVAWDPTWLVVACGERPCREVEQEVAAQPGLDLLSAARSDRILAIEPAVLYATGRGMLDLAEQLQERTQEGP